MDMLVEKKEGKIIWPNDVKHTLASLQDGYYMLTLTKGAKRTLEQNAYYRKLLTVIGEDLGYDSEQLHLYFKNMFLRKTHVHEILGEIVEIESTTKLTTKTFGEYVDKVIRRCGENGYEIPLEPR